MNTFSIFPFETKHVTKIDQRLTPYVEKWKLVEVYKGKTVTIPPDWDSHFKIINYFKVVKKENDPNTGDNIEEENEIGMQIQGGWFPYDSEVIINLFIRGKDVISGANKVSAEILKCGEADMKLYWNDKIITDFTEKKYWYSIHKDKIWIDDLSQKISP